MSTSDTPVSRIDPNKPATPTQPRRFAIIDRAIQKLRQEMEKVEYFDWLNKA
jgi:hypothetical protein